MASYLTKVKNRLEAKKAKNAFTEEDAATVATLVDAIEELENSEEYFTLNDIRDLLERIFSEAEAEKDADLEDQSEEAQNARRLRNSVRNSVLAIVAGVNAKKNWLKTDAAVNAFAECLQKVSNGKEFQKEWAKVLASNGVTGFVFPQFVDDEIQTKWKDKSILFSEISKVSDISFTIRFTSQDQADLDVRAKGHVKGAAKTDQKVILQSKTVLMSAIYKQIPFHRIDLAQLGDKAGATIKWFVTELGTQLAWEIDRCILIGDGRDAGSPDKVREIEGIANAAAGGAFVIRKETAVGVNAKLVDVYDLLLQMNLEGRTYAYFNRQSFGNYSKYTSPITGEESWHSEDEIRDKLGLTEVRLVSTPLVNAAGEEVAAIIVQPDGLVRVGGDIFGEQWSNYSTNEEYYRSEVFVGIGIRKLFSQGYIVNKKA